VPSCRTKQGFGFQNNTNSQPWLVLKDMDQAFGLDLQWM